MPPRALFELRHSLNPATLTVPADPTHPECTIHATGHPLNWAVATTFTPATQNAPAGYGKEVLSWTPPATPTERSTP